MAHVATITIDHTKVPGDLTDYVGLIVPDASAGYSALYALCLEGGGDIRLFKSDDTTELAREIVTFSASAETGEIHYKYAGTLSSSVDTDIHVYADGSSSDYAVGATYGRNAVWSDYGAVYHLKTGTDSTGNGNDLTATGVTFGGGTGVIGASSDFDGSNDVAFNSSTTELDGENTYTIQFWAEPDASARKGVFGKTDGTSAATSAWTAEQRADNKLRFKGYAGSSQSISEDSDANFFAANTYVMGHVVVDATSLIFYKNGASHGSHTVADTTTNSLTGDLAVGAFGYNSPAILPFNGNIDETRYRSSALTANHIAAEYNNQNSYSTFYSVAAVGGGSTSAQAARRGAVMMM